MPEPVVFISQFRVRADGEQPLRSAVLQAVDLIRSTKPGTALFAAYLADDASTVRFAHAFADRDAVQRHFEGALDRAMSVADLLAPAGFELYGDAPTPVVDQLRRDADAAGVRLERFPTAIGGFLRTKS
jgi:quinol monooxygenase YgiN